MLGDRPYNKWDSGNNRLVDKSIQESLKYRTWALAMYAMNRVRVKSGDVCRETFAEEVCSQLQRRPEQG